MNTLEEKAIMEISALDSVAFWHRNQEKGIGFKINGFMSNHYPDFIVKTNSGNTIIIETKGDHLDNSDSKAKARLGKKWAELAGKNFHYFMVFEVKDVPYAITLAKAKELIRQM
jgi:type III restriction enzyme